MNSTKDARAPTFLERQKPIVTLRFAPQKTLHIYPVEESDRPRPRNEYFTVDPRIAARGNSFGAFANTTSASEEEGIEVIEIDWAEEESKPSTAQKYPEFKEHPNHLKIPDYKKRLSRPAARPVGEPIGPSFTHFTPREAHRSTSSSRTTAGKKQEGEKEGIHPSFAQTVHRKFPLSGRTAGGENQGPSEGEIRRIAPQDYVPPWSPERVLERTEASKILLTKTSNTSSSLTETSPIPSKQPSAFSMNSSRTLSPNSASKPIDPLNFQEDKKSSQMTSNSPVGKIRNIWARSTRRLTRRRQ